MAGNRMVRLAGELGGENHRIEKKLPADLAAYLRNDANPPNPLRGND